MQAGAAFRIRPLKKQRLAKKFGIWLITSHAHLSMELAMTIKLIQLNVYVK